MATDSPSWKSRIIGHEEVSPTELLANPRNWRIHPQLQQEALEGVLDEVGWVDEIIVNQHTGFVVNGHLRVALALRHGQKTVPVKYVDLTEGEEMIILATLDPLAAMAVTDAEKLDEVMKLAQTENVQVAKMLKDLAFEEGIDLPSFFPEGEEGQPRLDEQGTVDCPECGHRFKPEPKSWSPNER